MIGEDLTTCVSFMHEECFGRQAVWLGSVGFMQLKD